MSSSTGRKRISEDDLRTVERCAEAVGKRIRGDQWIEVWEMLKAGVSPDAIVMIVGMPYDDT